MNALALALLGFGITAMLGILGWLGATTYTKLAEIEKSLSDMKVDMAKLQASLWTKEDIREFIQMEIAKHYRTYSHG